MRGVLRSSQTLLCQWLSGWTRLREKVMAQWQPLWWRVRMLSYQKGRSKEHLQNERWISVQRPGIFGRQMHWWLSNRRHLHLQHWMQKYCIRRKELGSSLHWEAAAVLLRDGGRGGRVEEKKRRTVTRWRVSRNTLSFSNRKEEATPRH